MQDVVSPGKELLSLTEGKTNQDSDPPLLLIRPLTKTLAGMIPLCRVCLCACVYVRLFPVSTCDNVFNYMHH